MYEISTEDFYKDIKKDVKKKFDTSDYPEKHESGIKTGVNQKVIRKFKDEAAGKQITQFVGLRAKLHCYKIEGEETKKCKGVKKSVVKMEINFDDYKRTLFTEEEEMRDMKMIRSDKHEIFSIKVNKTALSANDNKRLVGKDKIHIHALR